MAANYDVALTASIVNVLENPINRKRQLLSLYELLVRDFNVLREAVRTDLQWTDDVAIEAINQVLGAIEAVYPDISLADELEVEQKLSAGTRIEHIEQPLSLTLIIGSGQNPLGSTLLPLVGALAAGSVSIIVQPERTDKTSSTLSTILSQAVDHEGVQTVPASALDKLLRNRFDAVVVPPSYDPKAIRQLQSVNAAIRVLQPGSGLVAAIVDRSADLYSASVQIRNAFWKNESGKLFGGPKIVFVDEFVLDDLQEHLRDRQKGFTTRRPTKSSAKPASNVLRISTRDQAPTITSPAPSPLTAASVKELLRDTSIAKDSILIVPTTSTGHTLDMLNLLIGDKVAPAVYVFSTGPEVSFFSRFLRSQVTIANSIPPWALVNWIPQSPNATSIVPFAPRDFTNNHPVVQFEPIKKESTQVRSLPKKAVLKMDKRRETGLKLSFFERGIIIGGIGLLVGTPGAIYAITRGFRALYPAISSRFS
ncbi:uncharacterized protein FTJAE_12949 [Fusarium tjaetaba]|uniref:Aldehyde dehydrogenase domain-containing protein n=1 Tax=Fusarium tjaetaba TaxID=1567544 RepID=A0A8H5VCS5_9HYPO|nr:uncharacterized protein FTJAE_12949 [Fusarium tjaetaba]KAF5616474.1 hypothetical protein FTJAE_12949 [Fusarium tjaetaba]